MNYQEIMAFGKLNQGDRFIYDCKTYIKIEKAKTKSGDKVNAALLRDGSLYYFNKNAEVVKDC